MKDTLKPSGINRDINPAETGLDVWNTGSNVIFKNGFAAAAPGWYETAPGMTAHPLFLINVFDGINYLWIYAGNDDAETAGAVFVTDGSTHWDITPAGGLQPGVAGDWTGGVLNGVPFLNNRVDPPFYWDGNTGNAMLELPDWPAATRCEAMRAFKYHLVAMNITDGSGDYPDLVLWSDAADPGQIPQVWTPAPDNQAGNFSISTTTGGIVDGGEMRDGFMIYKTGSSTNMQYIAGQFVFSNRKAFVTSGILGRNCWIELYGQHYVITDGDFIRHNGQQVESLIDGQYRDYLFNQIDNNNYPSAHLAASHNDKQLWLNWPKSGHVHCDTALVFDLVSGKWGEVDFDQEISFMSRGVLNDPTQANDFDDRADSFNTAPDKFNEQQFNPTTDLLVMTRYDKQQLLTLEGFLREGAPVPIYLQMLQKDFGQAQQFKLITNVWVLAETAAGIESGTLAIRVGTQLGINDPINWIQAVGQLDGQKADVFAEGRYISLEIRGDQTANWRLNSLDVDYELTGFW